MDAHASASSLTNSALETDTDTLTQPPGRTRDDVLYSDEVLLESPTVIDQTLSDRIRQLAAVAWTLEQDEDMPARRRSRLNSLLESLQKVLNSDNENEVEAKGVDVGESEVPGIVEDEDSEQVVKVEPTTVDDSQDEWMEEEDLIAVRSGIAATVRAMRLRQEEQLHLHDLTVHKIEAVAQKCITQEEEMQEVLHELQELRNHNANLLSENRELRARVSELHLASAHRQVAVSAMSSAVTGLEGWINNTRPTPDNTLTPGKRRKLVVRGKGRFRGRYYVDEDGLNRDEMPSDNQEIHEGIESWLRGFRDVEEELRQHELRNRGRLKSNADNREARSDEDWGEFQAPLRSYA